MKLELKGERKQTNGLENNAKRHQTGTCKNQKVGNNYKIYLRN